MAYCFGASELSGSEVSAMAGDIPIAPKLLPHPRLCRREGGVKLGICLFQREETARPQVGNTFLQRRNQFGIDLFRGSIGGFGKGGDSESIDIASVPLCGGEKPLSHILRQFDGQDHGIPFRWPIEKTL